MHKSRDYLAIRCYVVGMKRYLDDLIAKDLARKMVLVTGPRQVGKTTLCRHLMARLGPAQYLNWDLGLLKIYSEKLLTLLAAYESGDPALIAAARQKADIDFLREDLPLLIAESQEGLGRVTKFVHDLKDFSHVDQVGHQQADLNAAMESTLNVVWNELKYKAEVVRELGDIPPVNCIPVQINQVFMNLLVNAAQAILQKGKIFVRSGI